MERDDAAGSDGEDSEGAATRAAASKEEEKKAPHWLNDYSPPPAPAYRGGRRGPPRSARKAPPPSNDPVDMEVERWFWENWTPSDSGQRDWGALKWWECHAHKFPRISHLARRILATQVGG
jgi:hypothetical protein